MTSFSCMVPERISALSLRTSAAFVLSRRSDDVLLADAVGTDCGLTSPHSVAFAVIANDNNNNNGLLRFQVYGSSA